MANKIKSKIIISTIVAALSFGFVYLMTKNDGFDEGFGFEKWDINATVNDDGSMNVVEELHFFNTTSDELHVSESKFKFGKAGSSTAINGTDESYLKKDSFKCSIYQNGNAIIENQIDPVYTNNFMYGYSWSDEVCEDELGRPIKKYNGYDKTFIYIENGLPKNGLVIKYEYTVENVVSKYDDYSVINWKFAGAYDDSDTKNVTVTVNFPSSASAFENNVSNEKFLDDGMTTIGFGSNRAKYTKVSPTQIVCYASKLKDSSNDEIEILTTFNNSVCDVFSNVNESSKTNEKGVEKVKKTITEAFEEENRYYAKHNAAEYIISIGGSLVVAGLIALIIYAYIKYDKERKPAFDGEYYRELPNHYGPAAMVYLYNEQAINKDAMNAQIMDLIRKKYITIDTNGCLLTDKDPNYIMIREPVTDTSELLESEKFLLHWIFDVMAKGNDRISFSEMDSYVKNAKNAEKYNSCNIKWNKIAISEGKKYPWFDVIKKPKAYCAFDLISIFLAAIAGLNIIIYNLSYYAIIVASLTVGLSIFGVTYFPFIKRKSQLGMNEYALWRGFNKFLKEFSHFEDYPVPSLIVWEEYMVYATAFGIADLVEKQLKMKYLEMHREAEYNSYPYFYYHTYYHICHRMDTNHMVGSQTIAAERAKEMSKSGGRSGGFGGGSSFGGGGRGGSFR